MIRARAFLLLVLLLAACGARPDANSDQDALQTLAGNPDRAAELVFVVPGALSPVWIFDPVRDWADADTAIIAYRFPGLDGRPSDERVRIDAAGAAIAAYANARQPRAVRIIGQSTGGPIALEAARRVRAERVDVALISTALPTPAVALTGLSGFIDLMEAANRAGTWEERQLFREYYRTLLYGRSHYDDPVLSADSDRRAEEVYEDLILPEDGMAAAHSGDLFRWTLRRPEDLAHVRVLLFHGSDDPLFSVAAVRRFMRRLPDAQLRVYPDQGHLLPETVPGLFGDIRRAMAP